MPVCWVVVFLVGSIVSIEVALPTFLGNLFIGGTNGMLAGFVIGCVLLAFSFDKLRSATKQAYTVTC